jgi:hypothetical protein
LNTLARIGNRQERRSFKTFNRVAPFKTLQSNAVQKFNVQGQILRGRARFDNYQNVDTLYERKG